MIKSSNERENLNGVILAAIAYHLEAQVRGVIHYSNELDQNGKEIDISYLKIASNIFNITFPQHVATQTNVGFF